MKVLMYHYIQEFNTELPYFLFLHVDNFKKQIAHLSANLNFISPSDDLLLALANASETDNLALLTFDDALRCHYKFVLPQLVKRNVQGIFYIPTAPYTDGHSLGVHKIHLILGKEHPGRIVERLNRLIGPEMLDAEHVYEFKEHTYKKQVNDQSTTWIKQCLNYFIDFRYREDIINRLFKDVFGAIKEAQLIDQIYLSLEEIRELVNAGMIIGSHTRTHRLLSKLSMRDALEERDSSFDFLETIVSSQSFRTFCYPYGGFHSFNSSIENALTDRKVEFSFNVESRDLFAKDYLERPQSLPRYNCNEFPFGAVEPI